MFQEIFKVDIKINPSIESSKVFKRLKLLHSKSKDQELVKKQKNYLFVLGDTITEKTS